MCDWATIDSKRLAPRFELQNAKLGSSVRLEDFAGQRVVIAFFPGMWAPWCRRFISELSNAASYFEQLGIKLLAIASQDLTELQNYIWESQIQIDLLADPHGVMARRYGIFDDSITEPMKLAKPALFMIDPQQNLSVYYIGKHLSDRPSTIEILDKAKTISA